MRVLEELKQGLEDVWESMTEGWQRLRQQTEGALTRFKPVAPKDAPAEAKDDAAWRPARWALLACDVYEDDRKVTVRMEVPGMNKDDLRIEMVNDVLIVQGEKQFQHVEGDGRYVSLQCAYGTFTRRVPLPVPVKADLATATYRLGVLRIDLPKDESVRSRPVKIVVE